MTHDILFLFLSMPKKLTPDDNPPASVDFRRFIPTKPPSNQGWRHQLPPPPEKVIMREYLPHIESYVDWYTIPKKIQKQIPNQIQQPKRKMLDSRRHNGRMKPKKPKRKPKTTKRRPKRKRLTAQAVKLHDIQPSEWCLKIEKRNKRFGIPAIKPL